MRNCEKCNPPSKSGLHNNPVRSYLLKYLVHHAFALTLHLFTILFNVIVSQIHFKLKLCIISGQVTKSANLVGGPALFEVQWKRD